MVSFGSGYYMPMDREYTVAAPKPAEKPTAAIGEIGLSLGLGIVQNIPAVNARLRGGTKTVELAFMGTGHGSGQAHTPEMYGELQRQALREMQKSQQVRFTTHAGVGIFGLAGMDQQGNFSRHSQSMAIDEIKKAIDFAADVSRGGSVVMHTGEFQRPISEAEWNASQGKDPNKKQFSMYEREGEAASFRVVDDRTGAVIQEARKNRNVSKPVWKTVKPGDEYIDFDHKKKIASTGEKIYIDYWGTRLSRVDRVPDFENGRFKTKTVGWGELQEEAKEMTAEARDELKRYHQGKMEPKEIDKSIWIERFKNVPKDKIDQIEVKPEEAYIITSLETNAANSRGWAIYYGKDFEEQINVKGELLKIKETVPVIFSMPDGEEKNKKIAELKNKLRIESDAELDEKKLIDSIGKQIKQVEHGINYGRESSASQWAQAEEMRETIKHVQSAESYALKESHRAYALAGMSAYQKTKQLEQQGKLEKPIYIAMENLFPESYGSHTDELISLVQNSRAQMTEMLKQKNMSESEAKKAAAEHIGATFDTGHFNMWKKYWRGDENKTVQQNEEAFKKWFLDQVEKLAKSGVVKHLHIVDNYGYQDEHLAPGQGNTPVKEAIEIFKKYGFKGNMIVEPGSATAVESSQFGGMTNTWKYLGASTYGSHGVASQRWGSIGNAYAGQMQPPYFVVGAYSPSEEWTLWSGTPLE